jgi:polyferredoxin
MVTCVTRISKEKIKMLKRQQIRKMFLIVMFLLFPIIFAYFSPYLIMLGASEGIVTASFIVFAFLFVFSLFFGRAWCGYVCPAGGLQECVMLAQNKKAKGGKLFWIKYFIWVPWLCTIIFLFIKAGGIQKVEPLFNIEKGISIAGHSFMIIIYFGVVAIFTIMSLLFGKRASCHYLCWMAPFMILGTKFSNVLHIPRLRIKADASKCIGCGKCNEKCAMSLDVKSMVQNEGLKHPECILCGECVDACPKQVIGYSFRR